MRENSLLFLRVSIGLLIVAWGLVKIVNPDHGIAVSDAFYLGLLSTRALQPVFGIIELAIGLAVVAGFMRKVAYPALLLLTGVSLLSVWRSVLDPWGWYLGQTNALLFPSLIIFAGALVLHAFRDQDTKAMDRRKAAV